MFCLFILLYLFIYLFIYLFMLLPILCVCKIEYYMPYTREAA